MSERVFISGNKTVEECNNTECGIVCTRVYIDLNLTCVIVTYISHTAASTVRLPYLKTVCTFAFSFA